MLLIETLLMRPLMLLRNASQLKLVKIRVRQCAQIELKLTVDTPPTICPKAASSFAPNETAECTHHQPRQPASMSVLLLLPLSLQQSQISLHSPVHRLFYATTRQRDHRVWFLHDDVVVVVVVVVVRLCLSRHCHDVESQVTTTRLMTTTTQMLCCHLWLAFAFYFQSLTFDCENNSLRVLHQRFGTFAAL
jgi:hypothetical protein